MTNDKRENDRQNSGGYKSIVIIALIVIVAFMAINTVSSRGSGMFGGFCFRNSESSEAVPGSSDLGQLGMQFYLDNTGDTDDLEGLEAVVRDFGCHQETHIYRDEQLVMRVGFSRGQAFQM